MIRNEYTMKKVAFHTLGCKVNQYETEAMEEIFLHRGYEAGTEEDCDVYVVNTCTVTHMSDAKSRRRIRRVKNHNPDAVVCVVGCYSQVSPEEVGKIPDVDILMGTKDRAELPLLVDRFLQKRERIVHIANLEEQRTFDELSIETELETTRAVIKIQEGCDMYCTYCIIPYARGHIASRSLNSILSEAKRLSERGFREVVLTGIHVASYGKESGAREQGAAEDLLDVVEAIAGIDRVDRIRLSSIEPRWVNPEKLKRLRETGKFCDHFHLSLQSGSDFILERMNRKYTTALYEEKCRQIREVFPDAGLTTDIIVGFPEESEENFQETVDFCNRIGFSRIHIFPYSKREGTPAALFRGQIPNAVKKERVARLSLLEKQLRHNFMDQHVGRTLQVLFEEYSGDQENIFGYSGNYIRVRASRNCVGVNESAAVRILSRDEDVLVGEVLQP